MFQELLKVLAIVLVFEGLLPSIAPEKWRHYMREMLEFEPGQLRSIGLVMMLAGALILFLLNQGST